MYKDKQAFNFKRYFIVAIILFIIGIIIKVVLIISKKYKGKTLKNKITRIL